MNEQGEPTLHEGVWTPYFAYISLKAHKIKETIVHREVPKFFYVEPPLMTTNSVTYFVK